MLSALSTNLPAQWVRRTVRAADEWTAPQADTGGNYLGNLDVALPAGRRISIPKELIPAIIEGAIEGWALRGVEGGLTSMTSAAAGVLAQNGLRGVSNRVVSNLCAVAVSASVGAAMAATTWPSASHAGQVRNLIGGALLGAFQTYRSDKIADVRAAGSFGTLTAGLTAMVGGPALTGPSKVAAGIGAAMGATVCEKPALKALLGAAVGGALGAALCALGFSPVGLVAAVTVSAAGGALGTIAGPRYSQFFRNFAKAAGKRVEKMLNNVPMSHRVRNSIGAVPSGSAKEGINGLVYSDGQWLGLLAGAAIEVMHQVAVFMFQHVDEEEVARDSIQKPVA